MDQKVRKYIPHKLLLHKAGHARGAVRLPYMCCKVLVDIFIKKFLEFLAEVLLDIQVAYLADPLEASEEAKVGLEEDMVDLVMVLVGLVEALVAQEAVLEATIQVVYLAMVLGDTVVAHFHPHPRHQAVGP